jgi:hypothetical protein
MLSPLSIVRQVAAVLTAVAACLFLPAPASAATGPLVGATTAPVDYPGTSYATAAQRFDAATHTSMALQAAKRYLGASQWPSVIGPAFRRGVHYLITLEPGFHRDRRLPPARTQSQVTQMIRFVSKLKAAGMTADYALDNEPSDHLKAFPTPAAYRSWFDYYAKPLAARGASVVYDAAGWRPSLAVAYYPGDRYISKVLADYYASAYGNHYVARLAPIAALADNHKPSPVPFGLGEWGWTAGRQVTLAQFRQYASYIGSFFAARQRAGKRSCYLIWWNGHGSNIVRGPSDPKAPIITKVYAAISARA